MTWFLVVTALINGQVYNADKVGFTTQAQCLQVAKQLEQHPLFKQYGAKASCEHESH